MLSYKYISWQYPHLCKSCLISPSGGEINCAYCIGIGYDSELHLQINEIYINTKKICDVL